MNFILSSVFLKIFKIFLFFLKIFLNGYFDKDKKGYLFSKAMNNEGFISIEDIQNIYMPRAFKNFKIEGRSLGSALLLEFIIYYMVKPRYQINLRELMYLDNMLDLF